MEALHVQLERFDVLTSLLSRQEADARARMSSTLSAARSRMDALEEDTAVARATTSGLAQERDAAVARAIALNEEVSALSHAVGVAESDALELREALSKANAQNDHLADELRRKSAALAERDRERARVIEGAEILQQECEERIESLTRAHTATISSMQRSLVDSTQKLSELENIFETSKMKLTEDFERKLAAQEAKRAAAEREISAALEVKTKEVANSMRALNAELESKNAQIDSALRECSELRAKSKSSARPLGELHRVSGELETLKIRHSTQSAKLQVAHALYGAAQAAESRLRRSVRTHIFDRFGVEYRAGPKRLRSVVYAVLFCRSRGARGAAHIPELRVTCAMRVEVEAAADVIESFLREAVDAVDAAREEARCR